MAELSRVVPQPANGDVTGGPRPPSTSSAAPRASTPLGRARGCCATAGDAPSPTLTGGTFAGVSVGPLPALAADNPARNQGALLVQRRKAGERQAGRAGGRGRRGLILNPTALPPAPRGSGAFYFKNGVYFCKTSQNGCSATTRTSTCTRSSPSERVRGRSMVKTHPRPGRSRTRMAPLFTSMPLRPGSGG